MPAQRCPCLSGNALADCCGPVMSGQVPAMTAQQLMRSRFTAFALDVPDYLMASWHPATRPKSVELDPQQTWCRLDIIATDRGGLLDTTGTVEFDAYFRIGRSSDKLHEISRFVRVDGVWLYLDGQH